MVLRDFQPAPAAVDTRWCGDITYIATEEGWLYLATVIDIASRRVVGWATADHLRTELVADARSATISTTRSSPSAAPSSAGDNSAPRCVGSCVGSKDSVAQFVWARGPLMREGAFLRF
ncbi:DDE-type integrase/transposase/recombinase [Streptomyces sp. NPDC004296]|uniref:DDE-type integrase/transposase/recombinase n=1 Tax=Streptomyces sp. NPDC004296 TaxID=3364697 RepID=UPI00368995CD